MQEIAWVSKSEGCVLIEHKGTCISDMYHSVWSSELSIKNCMETEMEIGMLALNPCLS